MKRHALILLFIPTFISVLRTQDFIAYSNFRNDAIVCFYMAKYQKAAELLDNAFANFSVPPSKDIFFYSVIQAHLDNKKKCKHYLSLSMLRGNGIPTSLIKREDQVFLGVFSENELDSLYRFNDQCNKINYQTEFDNFRSLKMDSISHSFIERDQIYRSNYNGDLEKDLKYSLMKESDRQLHIDLMEFVSEHGWYSSFSETLNTILIHFEEEEFLDYKPLLLKEVRQGRLDPYWYGSMEERIKVVENPDHCLYGIWNKNCDKELIEKNRRIIGMATKWEGPYRIYKKYDRIND